jgi:hypothetical protein
MPAATDTAITAISLLTVPAASDSTVAAAYVPTATSEQAVPSYLWRHAYSMYGFDTTVSATEVSSFVCGPSIHDA